MFKLSKKNLPHGCFHNLATFCKWFSGKNNNITKNSNRPDILTFNIAKCWCEIGCTSEGSAVNQSWSTQFPAATFSRRIPAWFMDSSLCHCDVWKGQSYVNANVSVYSIFKNGHFYLKYYFPCHRKSPSKRFNQVSIATCLFSIFIHKNTKNTIGLNIYSNSILEERSKALLKMFLIYWRRQTNVTEPSSRRHFRAFLYRCFFNIDYR